MNPNTSPITNPAIAIILSPSSTPKLRRGGVSTRVMGRLPPSPFRLRLIDSPGNLRPAVAGSAPEARRYQRRTAGKLKGDVWLSQTGSRCTIPGRLIPQTHLTRS